MGKLSRSCAALACALALSILASGCSSTAAPSATTLAPGESHGDLPSISIAPSPVAGSQDSGSATALGPVERLPVVAVAAGATVADVPLPGSAAYSSVVTVGYRQFGAGPPIVLSVTVFDPPGIGWSGPPTHRVTIAWLADITAGLCSELGLARPTVLGWGMGGQIALEMAARHEGIASSVVVVDSAMPVPGADPMTRAGARVLDSPSSTYADYAKLLFPTPGPGSSASLSPTGWLADLEDQVPDTVTASGVDEEAAAEAALWQERSDSKLLGTLHVPVLVVAGSEDTVFPPADADALSSAIPGSQRYLWAGVGYGDLVADPSHFMTVLEGFTG
jgi:3-oxoadipate enol-lactonase